MDGLCGGFGDGGPGAGTPPSVEKTGPRHRPLFANLLSIPREIRHDLYQRLLVARQPLFLFLDNRDPRSVEMFAPGKPFQALAIICTNRQIHAEAAAVLYGLNHFIFLDNARHQVELIRSFLGLIGRRNAGLLGYLSINFPVVEVAGDLEGNFVLREDSLATLMLLKDRCTQLKQLETHVHHDTSAETFRSGCSGAHHIRRALSQIDSQLKQLSSLSEVIVTFYTEPPSLLMEELMREFGWTVRLGR
ncbi:hypothetical protein JX266_007980 [Neoarthrinium moseri]|uniref:uncharacterized protein n=1 Tax=Neoarthrinium moseri TaxID=1658444 RepID=UPI001FDB8850|nr:uncharacterized protein JN550_010517 [Neoarthrinium moseri]KAI1845893.1 hypothetical protein JX266_007980 [Neoarthrinium moseri]KAI1862052.1 hypothetical protein JN550_010517 [Neoarthrinium moseri]